MFSAKLELFGETKYKVFVYMLLIRSKYFEVVRHKVSSKAKACVH